MKDRGPPKTGRGLSGSGIETVEPLGVDVFVLVFFGLFWSFPTRGVDVVDVFLCCFRPVEPGRKKEGV